MHFTSDRTTASPRRRAFTLTELLVVIAIMGALMALLIPAVMKVREAAHRMICGSQMRQVALAMHHHHQVHGRFPYARKYDSANAYTWYQHLLPFLEQDAAYRNFHNLDKPGVIGLGGDDAQLREARMAVVKAFFCPSDTGPSFNQPSHPVWGRARGNYRACVGPGDLYGEVIDAKGPSGPGVFTVAYGQRIDGSPAPLRSRLDDIKDGASNTILLSEGLNSTLGDANRSGGPLGDVQLGNMGGSLFSTFLPPNSRKADRIVGSCPQTVGAPGYNAPCSSMGNLVERRPGDARKAHAAARSRHPNGVNVAFADGSVRFFHNTINTHAWRSMGTRAGGEVFDDQAPDPPQKQRTGPIKVLFIGNSYTEGNGLPWIVAGLAQAAGEARPLEVDAQLQGGATFQMHYNNPAVIQKIKSNDWEYVVMQEQSMMPIVNPNFTIRWGSMLGNEVTAIEATPLLFLTWARKHLPDTQQNLNNTYYALASAVGGEVAPVGIAWEMSYGERPDLVLHDPDNSHPNAKGTYLAACVFYASIYGKSPEGLPAAVSYGGKSISIPLADAQFLQRIAAQAVGTR